MANRDFERKLETYILELTETIVNDPEITPLPAWRDYLVDIIEEEYGTDKDSDGRGTEPKSDSGRVTLFPSASNGGNGTNV